MPDESPLPVTERTRHRRLREQGSTDRGGPGGHPGRGGDLSPRRRGGRLPDGRADRVRAGRRHAVPARLGGQPQPGLGAAGYRLRDRDPRGRAGAGQVGVRARGQLPQRDDLRHAPAGDGPGGEAGRAARSDRAPRARPVGLRPPPEQEGTGQDLAARAGPGRGVGEDPHRPARRRRLARTRPCRSGQACCRWPPPGRTRSPTRCSRPGYPLPPHIAALARRPPG